MATETEAKDTATSEESAVNLTKPDFHKVGDLSPASVGFNLIVKVGKIKPIMNRLNLDGTSLKISEAIIGDATGCIILSLRNGMSFRFQRGSKVHSFSLFLLSFILSLIFVFVSSRNF